MQNIFIDILPPWVETGLQPAFYDLESGTVLQQTARMYAKVRELTEAYNTFTQNIINEVTTFEKNTNDEIERFENATNDEIERFENATNDEIERFENATNDEIKRFEGVINDTVEEYIGKFNELHDYVEDYFDNLDVQKEINNKLDDMVEQGTLQEIITTYIQANVAWTFDSVADMKSATNLTNGSFAQTLGFYSVDDGGKSLYKITNTGTADEMSVIALQNNLYAHLVVKDEVYVEQFGAKGDGTTDDSDTINACLASGASVVNFTRGKTYMVRGYEDGQPEGSIDALWKTTGLIIHSNQEVNLHGATVKCITNSRKNYNIFTIAEVTNVKLHNGYIVGDRDTHTDTTGEWGYGVAIKYSNNITLEDLTISECWGDGINLDNNSDPSTLCKNIVISRCICDANRRQGMSVGNGRNIIVEKCVFKNTGNNSLYTNPSYGVDVEPGYAGNIVKDLLFKECEFTGNKGCGLGLLADSVGVVVGVKVINCKILNNLMTPSNSAFSVVGCTDVEVIGNLFDNGSSTRATVVLTPGNDMVFEGNTVHNAFVFLRSTFMSDGNVFFRNNHIDTTINGQYNGIVQSVAVDGSSNTNNHLVFENNYFESNPDTNFTGWIDCPYNSGFTKLEVRNNIFKYGFRHISTNASNIISGNTFIACWGLTINLGTGNANQVSVIEDNVFEEPSFNYQVAGVIWNVNNNNIILQNNVVFKNCLSVGDQQTRTYSPNRFLQYENPTGVSLNVNNNILDNTIS